MAAAADHSPVVVDRMRAVRRLGPGQVIHKPEVAARNRQLLVDRIHRLVVRATHRLEVAVRNLAEVVHSPMACHIRHKLPAAMVADQAAAGLAVPVLHEPRDQNLRLQVAVVVVEVVAVAVKLEAAGSGRSFGDHG